MRKPGRIRGRLTRRVQDVPYPEPWTPRTCAAKDLLAVAVASLLFLGGCARPFHPGSPTTVARAKQATTYSAEVRLTLDSPDLKARTPVLVGFHRPEALRIEVPGPGSARLIGVARDGRFVAVFPAEQAFFEGEATPEVFEALFGVGLGPSEVMDLLLGIGGSRVREYRADWGRTLPQRIEAVLPDGGKLKLRIVAADLDPSLAGEAFVPPAHDGFRRISVDEARALWQ